MLSFVYENALGGNAINSNYHDGQNIYGWYQNWTGNYWSSSYYEAKGSTTRFGMEMSAGYPDSAPVSNNNYFRCVRDNTNSGKKYPYLMVESSGVTIVSRDASGGTDPSVLFASGETPDTSVRLKIPVVMVKLGRKQKRHAKVKGVAGVYLLSVRCI